jgi:hypothetical protein
LIHLDSEAGTGVDSLNQEQINSLLQKLYQTEQNMAASTMNRDQFGEAEGHCQRCLAYSRRFEFGLDKITCMFTALRTYCNLLSQQGNLLDALTFAEEAYNLVVEAYDPVHPQVQEAAGLLIQILILKCDLYDAERYAQVTYSNLRDKKNGTDQESEAVAMGALNLANVIVAQKGDLIKAEELARESLRTRTLIFGSNHQSVGRSCYFLTDILVAQNNLGGETRGFFELYLANTLRNWGPDGIITAGAYMSIGNFYYKVAKIQNKIELKKTYLLLAKSHLEEESRIKRFNGYNESESLDSVLKDLVRL